MTNHEQDDWGDDGGLRPRLDAYADARLRADPEARARSRASVMAEARAVAHTRRLAANPVQALPRHRLVFGRFRVPAAIAATLLLVGALTVGAALAGSGPGGPFYAARLWVEELTLPTDADARAEAQIARLEARLAEAAAAAEAGNGAAVTAALDAYRATAEAALVGAGDDPTRREPLSAQLGRHVVVLRALVPLVPDRASEAIQAAVDRTEVRIQEILATPPGATPGKPEATPPGKPEATPKLPATSKPTPAGPSKTPPGKPEATPKLPATPKPTPAGPSKTPPGKPETPPGKQAATPAP